jgi:hypothetical protein
MYRRRRRSHEIEFSFDSFLDVVANVVGIIIRLILVVWVGARSYTALHPPTQRAEPAAATRPDAQLQDPLEGELERQRHELAALQARLLEELRHLQAVQEDETAATGQLAGVSVRRQQLEQERAALQRAGGAVGRAEALSFAELRERCRKLTEEIRAVEKLPAAKKVLRYQTPVSQPVHTDELHFECRHGRVAFIDLAALMEDLHNRADEHLKQLRSQWEVRGVAGPVGAFQLRYVLERERGMADAALGGVAPDAQGAYRAGLSSWEVDPVAEPRGEALDAALAPRSEFRQVADALDPQQTTVTFWAYPDSFPLYRRLRDYLYQRDVIVAGRPLPDGVPIAASKHGSRSRGQ